MKIPRTLKSITCHNNPRGRCMGSFERVLWNLADNNALVRMCVLKRSTCRGCIKTGVASLPSLQSGGRQRVLSL